MTVRPQYNTLKDHLRRMASSPHFISFQGDKDTIGYAADVIERLTKRVAQLDETIEHLKDRDPLVDFCFAIVTGGVRCVRPSGHAGSHQGTATSREWTAPRPAVTNGDTK